MGVRAEGLGAVRRHLGEVKASTTQDGLSSFLEALGNLGARRARGYFAAAAGDYPGNPSVSVEAVRGSPGTYRVEATGPSVLFIEFGSGVSYPLTNPADVPENAGGGSWSRTHANAIKRDGLWIYEGAPGGDATPVTGRPSNVWWTRGNASANAMYKAGRDMRQAIADEWRKHVQYQRGSE